MESGSLRIFTTYDLSTIHTYIHTYIIPLHTSSLKDSSPSILKNEKEQRDYCESEYHSSLHHINIKQHLRI